MTTTPSALAAAALTINGVSTASIALGTDSETNREMVAKAINDISGQTGVRANNTGDDQQGVTLVADDGRNITLQFDSNSVLSSTNTGLSTSGTFVGTFSLYSANGASINVDNRIGSDLTGTGLRSGTYEPDIAAMVSLERSGSGAPAAANAIVGQAAGIPPSAGGVGVLSGDTLVINDIAISAARTTDDTASIATTASAKAASAIAIAAAINKKSDLTGVTARAEPNVIRSETDSSFVSTSASGSINLNGVTISLSAPTRNTVIDVINEFSGQTGVVARVYGEGVELVAEDGRNIVLATSAELSASNLGLAGITLGGGSTVYQTGETPTAGAGVAFYASVSLTSDRAFTVARGSEGGENFERLGFRAGLFGGNDTGTKIDEVNVSTQEGASAAIGAIDHALEDVYAAQAKSGAYQNRLDVIINVLSESTENLQASRSRILDADYALEATNLAKAQIVSQAATAMLAQANQSQQTVLSLLQ
jgi:flagellin